MTAIDLLRWLGETSLALSILILLVLIIRKPFTKAFGARAAYALWLAPAARLFLPELKVLPAPEAPALPLETIAYAWETRVAPTPPMTEFLTPGIDWLALAAGAALFLWAAVAFAWFCFKLETQAKFMRSRMDESTPASPGVTALANEIATDFRLRRSPQVRINKNDDDGPCLIGLLRPVIFLPAGFEKTYAAAEQRLVLAHEIAHLARGDMAATLAALFLQAAQWPNPLAHFSFTAFRTDQEAACDAYVLSRCNDGAEGNYASAILKSVRREMKAPAFGLALAHPVKERIMLLKTQKKSPLRLLAGATAAAAFTAVSLAATASYGFADDKTETKEVKKEIKKKSLSRTVISVDEGETLEIKGIDGASKVEIREEGGERIVKTYDKDGKLVSEKTYGPDEEIPFDEVTIVGRDGKKQTIMIKGAHGASMAVPAFPSAPGVHRVMLMDGDGDELNMDFDSVVDFDSVAAFHGIEGEHDFRKVIVRADGPGEGHRFHMSECVSSEEGGDAMVWAWKDSDGDEEKKVVSHQLICLTDDEAAEPAQRAETLRKMIDRIEENGKRDAERRKETLKRLREQLKEAEKQK